MGIGESLEKALQQMEDSVTALAKLPKLVQKEIQGKDSPDDVAKLKTDGMKKALKGGDVSGPLGMIKAMSTQLLGLVALVEKGVQQLMDFLGQAPDQIRSAFSVPAPCCCLTAPLLGQVPAMKTLLEMVDKLKNVDFDPVVKVLQNASGQIGKIEIDAVKKPIEQFQSEATGLIDKIDKTVSAAALASNPAGAMGGAVGKMKG